MDEQPSLFAKEPAEDWQIGPGIGGFVAYKTNVATESWNTPAAAIKAANAGQVSRKFYRDYLALVELRKANANK